MPYNLPFLTTTLKYQELFPGGTDAFMSAPEGFASKDESHPKSAQDPEYEEHSLSNGSIYSSAQVGMGGGIDGMEDAEYITVVTLLSNHDCVHQNIPL